MISLRRGVSIEDALESFEATLAARGRTEKHRRLTLAHIRALCADCGIRRVKDLEEDGVTACIRRLMAEGRLSPATINHRITAVRAFCKWLVDTGRTAIRPLAGLRKVPVRQRRHARRALSEKEIKRLLKTARKGGKLRGLAGETRALLYRFVLETGLRFGEIRSLRPHDVDLDDLDAASVTVDGAYTKNGKPAIQPLNRDLAERLAVHLAGLGADEPVFYFSRYARPADMLKMDLDAAGIPYRDAAGRVLDFHSLRHTFVTRLARCRIHPSIAKELARHADIRTTLNVYTHCEDQKRGAVRAMMERTGSQKKSSFLDIFGLGETGECGMVSISSLINDDLPLAHDGGNAIGLQERRGGRVVDCGGLLICCEAGSAADSRLPPPMHSPLYSGLRADSPSGEPSGCGAAAPAGDAMGTVIRPSRRGLAELAPGVTLALSL